MQRCLGCMREFSKNYNICPFCGYVVGTEPDIKNHLLPGTQLANRYILGKAIGHGGFGITYIARDSKIQKTVAIKEYFPNAFSTRSAGETRLSCYNSEAESFLKEGIKKMLDEAKRMSKFSNNENVVDIYDFFEENNTAYIVMEYLEGKDLKKYLEEIGGKLKPEKAVEIMLPVLNALEDMHKENLIHRDISPDNIFICNNGKIKVLDFGSARLAVEERDKSFSVMVKRGYAPKEQYTSRSKQGPWTDVYAVCATLYKMITGSLPVESTERDGNHLKSFSEFGVKDCNGLESVIFRGLEVEYTNRIQSVPELKYMLTKNYAEKPASAKKSPAADKSRKKKKIITAVILAVAAVAVIVCGAFGLKALTEIFSTAEPETTNGISETAIPEVQKSEFIHRIYANFLETAEAKKYFEVSPAFRSYYSDYEEYNNYVNSIIDKEKFLSYFDLDGDGTDECILSVCFYADALDHYVFYIFDIDGVDIKCVDSASDLYGEHRSLAKLQIFQKDGEYFIRKYYHDPHERTGSVYKYNGKSLEFVESMSMFDTFASDQNKYVWNGFYSNKYDFFDIEAANYLYVDSENDNFASDYNLKEISDIEMEEITDGYNNNEVYSITGEKNALWETFEKSGYCSNTLTTYYEYRDFNKDGHLEMFALKFKEQYEESAVSYIVPAALYLVSQQGVKVVEEDILATPGGNTSLYFIGGRWFFGFMQRFSGGHYEHLYTVVDENAVNVSLGGSELEIIGNNEVSSYFVDYNGYLSGGGRTNIYYYFYWDEDSTTFKEFGAIDIKRDEFLKCEGAAEILENIENDGFNINSIHYRKNGIITINCDNGEIYVHFKYNLSENNELTFIDGSGNSGEWFGYCEVAVHDDEVVFPGHFPV